MAHNASSLSAQKVQDEWETIGHGSKTIRDPSRHVADEAGEHELWRNDLKDFDLGLMEDKLERTVREAYNKYLLTDAGAARLVPGSTFPCASCRSFLNVDNALRALEICFNHNASRSHHVYSGCRFAFCFGCRDWLGRDCSNAGL